MIGIVELRSNPEQKVVPLAPVRTTARIWGSRDNSTQVLESSQINSGLSEFLASGRFKVTIATKSVFSILRTDIRFLNSNVLKVVVAQEILGVSVPTVMIFESCERLVDVASFLMVALRSSVDAPSNRFGSFENVGIIIN